MSVIFTRNDDKLETELGGKASAGFLPAAPHHIIPVSAFGDQHTSGYTAFDHDAADGRLNNNAKGDNGARVAIQQAYEEIRNESFNVNDERNGIWLPGDELASIDFGLALHSAGSENPFNLEGGLHNRSGSYTKSVTKHLHAITNAYNKTLTLTLHRIEKAYDGKKGERKQKDIIEDSQALEA